MTLESRFTRLYFWVFWLQCIHGTYLNLWFKREQGMTGTHIGTISAVYAMAGVLLSPLIATRFDASRRKPAFLAALAVVAGVAFCLMAPDLPLLLRLPVAVVLGCGWLPLVPLLDSITVGDRVAGSTSRGYGGFRRWGSVGFAVGGAVVGEVTGWRGLWLIFPAYLACSLLVARLAATIPRAAIPRADHTIRPSAVLGLLSIAPYRTFLLVTLFSYAGGSMCYAFRAIYLHSIGLGDEAIGRLWLLLIPGEVACFTYARRLAERWPPGLLMLAGTAIGGLRWMLLARAEPPALYAVEFLHGVSFAVYFPAATAFVGRVVPERLRGTAQTIFFACGFGIGGSIGAYAGGRLYDAVGLAPVLTTGGVILTVTGVMMWLLLPDPRRKPVPA
jgi:predicted MFS family arabinose efflux permease